MAKTSFHTHTAVARLPGVRLSCLALNVNISKTIVGMSKVNINHS